MKNLLALSVKFILVLFIILLFGYQHVSGQDYAITTVNGTLVVSDQSGNSDILIFSQDGDSIRIITTPSSRTYSIDGGDIFSFTIPAKVALIGLTSVLVNAGGGNDEIHIASFSSQLPQLEINGGQGDDLVRFIGNSSLMEDADLLVDLQDDDPFPGEDNIFFDEGVQVTLQGSGKATFKASRHIRFLIGALLSTEDGDIVVECNQMEPYTFSSSGVWLNGAQIQITGNGSLTILARGGSGFNGSGVTINNNGKVLGGLGKVTVTGIGANQWHTQKYGIFLSGEQARITSLGGDVECIGISGITTVNGNPNQLRNIGVNIDGGEISAGGNGEVYVEGRGGNARNSFSQNFGVWLAGSDSRIVSNDGNVTVVGYGGGQIGIDAGPNHGVYLIGSCAISAGLSGNVYVEGQGGSSGFGSLSSSKGVLVEDNGAKISALDGNLHVVGRGGNSGLIQSVQMNGVMVTNGGEISTLGLGSVLVEGYGGEGYGSNNHGVHIINLGSKIVTEAGKLEVKGFGQTTPLNNTLLNDGVRIESGQIASNQGDIFVDGTGGVGAAGVGVNLINLNSTVSSESGEVVVKGQRGVNGSGGVGILNGGVISTAHDSTIELIGDGQSVIEAKGVRHWGSIVSNGGNIIISGSGGEMSFGQKEGVIINSSIETVGTGSIYINGMGGIDNPFNGNYGIHLNGSSAEIKAEQGDVVITGSSSFGIAVLVENGASVKMTDGGNIFVNGNNLSGNSRDIIIQGANTTLINSDGEIHLNALSGGMLLQNGAEISTNGPNANVFLTGEVMILQNEPLVSTQGSAFVQVNPTTNSRPIDLGGFNKLVSGPFSLSNVELGYFQTSNLIVGNEQTASIKMSNEIELLNSTNVQLNCAGNIEFESGLVTAGGNLTLNANPGNSLLLPTFEGTDASLSNGTFSGSGNLQIRINGSSPGNGIGNSYSQLTIDGGIDLSNIDVNFTGNYLPLENDVFTIVNNLSNGSIIGTFSNLPQGGLLQNLLGSGKDFKINYSGGDGNDVVLVNGCVINIDNLIVVNESSCDSKDGEIQLTASCPSCDLGSDDLEYSLDGINYFTNSGYFFNLQNGIYTVYVRDTSNENCVVESVPITVDLDIYNPPLIDCESFFTIRELLNDECGYVVVGQEFDASFMVDNCPGVTINFVNNYNGSSTLEGAFLPIGETSILWEAIVSYGNSSLVESCEVLLTIVNESSPLFDCSQIPTFLSANTGDNQYTVNESELDPIVNKDCFNVVFNTFNSQTTLDGALLPFGNTSITWFAYSEFYFFTCNVMIQVQCLDADGDGWTVCDGDCDDNDSTVYPGAPEICGDGKDNDCNGLVDDNEDPNNLIVWHLDLDGDGWGDPHVSSQSCGQPEGYVSNDLDCDDTDSDIFPGQGCPVCSSFEQTWLDQNQYNYLFTFLEQYLLFAFGEEEGTFEGYLNAARLSGEIPLGMECHTCAFEWLDCLGIDPTVCLTNCLNVTDPTDCILCNLQKTACLQGFVTCVGLTDEDNDGWASGSDCNDDEPLSNPFTVWYLDADGDGFYVGEGVVQCDSPGEGYVFTGLIGGGDCNDENPSINPGATEVCNGIDDNCSGEIDDEVELITYYADVDGDGFGNPEVFTTTCEEAPIGFVTNSDDCDDTNPDINIPFTWYQDNDGDGWGNPLVSIDSCEQPDGYVLQSRDCDDEDPTVFFGQGCNFCSTQEVEWIDQHQYQYLASFLTLYIQSLSSGGEPSLISLLIEAFQSEILPISTDCHSCAFEWLDCLGIDPTVCLTSCLNVTDPTDCILCNLQKTACLQGFVTCVGLTDEDNDGWALGSDCDDEEPLLNPFTVWYLDADADGYYVGEGIVQCESPGEGYAFIGLIGGGDCNDENPSINPGAAEICNGIDDNCSGEIDDEVEFITYYRDADGDGFGNPEVSITTCEGTPDGYVANWDDCDDSDSSLNPNTFWYLDGDDDGYYSGVGIQQCESPGPGYKLSGLIGGNDCDDQNAAINPGAIEICNGIDDNCNGLIDGDDPDLVATPLSILCPENQVVYLDQSCTASLPDYSAQISLIGGCGDVNLNNPFDSNLVETGTGELSISFTATDEVGQSASCSFLVMKLDTLSPQVICMDQTISFNGEDGIVLDAQALSLAMDNCGIGSIHLSINAVDPSMIGQTIPVTVTVIDDSENSSFCISNVSISGLPFGWSQNFNGVNCTSGSSANYNIQTQQWTLTSTNCFYGPSFSSDQIAYVSQQLCGNGSVVAHVVQISGTGLGWAGVTMRESGNAGSKKAQIMSNLTMFSRREFRSITNGTSFPQQFPSANRYWLRVTRSNNQFSLHVSPDGWNWFFAGAQNIEMPSCIEAGLVVTNYNSNSVVEAIFEHVQIFNNNPAINVNQYPNENTIPLYQVDKAIDFTVYPNPSRGMVWVAMEEYKGKIVEIQLIDMHGRIVSHNPAVMGGGKERIDLTHLNSGVYLIKVKSEGVQDQMKRIIIHP